jgi:DNA-binding MarR family transcriptional regulator
MSANTTFGTQLIGQTEKTLNHILDGLLAGTSLTEPQWITLTVAVMSGGAIETSAFVTRIAEATKVSEEESRRAVDKLADAGLFDVGEQVSVTEAGQQLQARVRGEVQQITAMLWGDLPAEDLETAGRVLATALDRANAYLAR